MKSRFEVRVLEKVKDVNSDSFFLEDGNGYICTKVIPARNMKDAKKIMRKLNKENEN